MKLNTAQVRKVEDQLGVQAVPEENPSVPKLKEVFGDHSFFVDAAGLNIVEVLPSPESPNEPPADNSNGNVVRLARWVGEEHTELAPQEPELLSVEVEIAQTSNGADGAS